MAFDARKKLELEIWWLTGIIFLISGRIIRFFHVVGKRKIGTMF